MYLLGTDDTWNKEFSKKAEATRRRLRVVRTTNIVPYLKDYRFFVLSPLYVYAGVRYSLPDQFEAEAGAQDRILVDYRREVIGGLGNWSGLIEGIRVGAFEDFCHYLSTLLFVSVPRKIVWQLRQQDIAIESTDAAAVIAARRAPVRISVFLPDGNRGRMRLTTGLPAKLWWDKPHNKILEMSKQVLGVCGRIEDAS